MNNPKPIRRREPQLAFEALAIEGALLSPDWLAKAAQLKAPLQADADYRIEKGLNLRDEIARSFRIAQAHFRDFSLGRSKVSQDHSRLALSVRFVSALLKKSLGFDSLEPVPIPDLQGRAFDIGHAALAGRVPVVIAPAALGIDSPLPLFADGTRRRSAFGIAQEFLNAAPHALWGICSDGLRLRILRDNQSLTRPAWIEADLERIFTEERYADFSALWLLAHESRFGHAGDSSTSCILEQWRILGQEEGTRAREFLRRGVEEALVSLGQGFLAHPHNRPLRDALFQGKLSVTAYFQQLLRLVYRMIFLLTAEERALLHPEDIPDPIRRLYAQGYGMRRLRDSSVRRSAHDRHYDLWISLRIVFKALEQGEPLLGLPALGGLFEPGQCQDLQGSTLENRFLSGAVLKLSWLREHSGLSRVNWRDMGSEELGSVYESLLELVPQVSQDCRNFGFASGNESKGNARKLSGSYYTPESLVQVLLNSALEPVVNEALASDPARPEEALLNISVVDPACGSGHFLLASARRLASHLARIMANGTPSAADYRKALRKVVGRCVYGVDLNPLAVELCKVSLWMEAVEPGRPLSFLNSHIRRGNALLGATPELMESRGIPDEAWEALEGDDKKVATALKKRNKKGAGGQRGLDALWSKGGADEAKEVALAVEALEGAPDDAIEGLRDKERRWKEIQAKEAYRHQRLVADAWCAAFVWPKQTGELSDAAPVNEVWRQVRDKQGKASELMIKTVEELAGKYSFFHWHLEFPTIFGKGAGRGGFGVVLGNPPYVASYSRESHRSDKTLRETMNLSTVSLGEIEGNPAFTGRMNLFLCFISLATKLIAPRGIFSYVLPDTIITNESYEPMRRALLSSNLLTEAVLYNASVFEGATVGTATITGKRRNADETRVSLVRSRNAVGSATGPRDILEVQSAELLKRPCASLLPEKMDESAHKLTVPLSEVVEIKDGINPGPRTVRDRIISKIPLGANPRWVIEGEDIIPFRVRWPGNKWIDYSDAAITREEKKAGTSLRQAWIFDAPKIVYRQTAPRPIAAVDGEKLCTLNSVHCIILKNHDDNVLWALCAYLNSAICGQLYQNRTGETRKVFPQIHISSMRELPVPRFLLDASSEMVLQLAQLARQAAALARTSEGTTAEITAKISGRIGEMDKIIRAYLST